MANPQTFNLNQGSGGRHSSTSNNFREDSDEPFNKYSSRFSNHVLELAKSFKRIQPSYRDSESRLVDLWLTQKLQIWGTVKFASGECIVVPPDKIRIASDTGLPISATKLRFGSELLGRNWQLVFSRSSSVISVWPLLKAGAIDDSESQKGNFKHLDPFRDPNVPLSDATIKTVTEGQGQLQDTKNKGTFYNDPSQSGHHYRSDRGHIADTKRNRLDILYCVRNERNFDGFKTTKEFINKKGDFRYKLIPHYDKNTGEKKPVKMYSKMNKDGSQTWCELLPNGKLKNQGRNLPGQIRYPRKAPGTDGGVYYDKKNPGNPDDPDPDGGGGGSPPETPPPPPEPPGCSGLRGRVRQNNLQDTHNAANPGNQISKPGGSSGQIGGVGLDGALIHGLFDSLQNHREYQHLFFLPGKDLPFSNQELRQILQELAVGIFANDSVPYFSLHFNQKRYLYPVIHPVYQNTLVGEVFAMLDYLMKGFLNGGFFDKQTVESWNQQKCTNDPQNLRSFSNYVLENLHQLDPGTEYFSLTSIIDILKEQLTDSEKQALALEDPVLKDYDNFNSAFRIIAQQSAIKKGGNLFSLDGNFEVFYDLNIDPVYEEHLRRHRLHSGQDPISFKILSKAYGQMSRAIKQTMPQLPVCSKYFKMLKVIHFFAYYFKTLKAHQKVPVLQPSTLDSERRAPMLFPSLPISTLNKDIISIQTDEIFKYLTHQEKVELREYLSAENAPSYPPQKILSSVARAVKIRFGDSGHYEFLTTTLHVIDSNIATDALNTERRSLANVDLFALSLNLLSQLRFHFLNPEKVRAKLNTEIKSLVAEDKDEEIVQKAMQELEKLQGVIDSSKIDHINKIESVNFYAVRYIKPYADEFFIPDLTSIKSIYDRSRKRTAALLKIKRNQLKSLDFPLDLNYEIILPSLTTRYSRTYPDTQTKVYRHVVGGCGLGLTAKPVVEDPRGVDLIKNNLQQVFRADAATWFAMRSPRAEGFAFKLDLRDFYAVDKNDYHWLAPRAPIADGALALEKALVNYLREKEGACSQAEGKSFLQNNRSLASAFLMRAASEPTPDQLKKLIGLEVDLHLTDNDGFTALHYAIHAKRATCAMVLIIKAPSLQGVIANDGNSPVMLAASSGCASLLQLLLNGPTETWKRQQLELGTSNEDLCCQQPPEQNTDQVATSSSALPSTQSPVEDGAQIGDLAPTNRLNCTGRYSSTLTQTSHNGMTPLFSAVELGDETAALALLNVQTASSFIDIAIEDGTTPLSLAAERGHLEIVKALINKGADVNLAKKNGYRALHLATAVGRKDILQVLLSAPGIDRNACIKTGKSALHVAAQFDHWPCAQLLLEKGVNTTLRGWDEETFFITAIAHDSIWTAGNYVRQEKWHTYITRENRSFKVIEYPDRLNRTAIDIAHHHRSTKILSVMDAVFNRFVDESDLLIAGAQWLYRYFKYGAPGNTDNIYLSPEKRFLYMCQNEWSFEQFLKHSPTDTLTKEQLSRGLQLAARSNRELFTIDLLSLGPNRIEDLPDEKGRTSLHYAAQFDWHTVVQSHLAKLPQDFDREDGKEWTPIMIAAANNSRRVLKTLVNIPEQLANLREPSKTPLPHPLQLALEGGHTGAVEILLEAMDDANLPLNETDLRGFHVAAKFGDVSLLKALKAQGAKWKLADQRGRTALHFAIAAGRIEALNFLLELTWPDSVLATLVHCAVDHNQVKAIAVLNERNFSLETHHPDTLQTPLFHAVQGQHCEVLFYLIHLKVNVNAVCNNQMPLHLAAKLKFSLALDRLAAAGGRLSTPDTAGKTPLQLAVEGQSALGVKFLMANGALFKMTDEQFKKCLAAAQKSGRWDLVYLLEGKSSEYDQFVAELTLIVKADDVPAFKRKLGKISINAQILEGELRFGFEQPLLHLAYLQGKKSDQSAVFKWLLQQPNLEINAPNSIGYTLAHLMAIKEDVPSDRALSLSTRDASGDAPLHLYAKSANTATLKAVLELAGADSAFNRKGQTPLFAAIKEKRDENVALLLKNRADPNALDLAGYTPLHRALKKSCSDFVIKELLKAGADPNLHTQNAERLTPLSLAAERGSCEQILQLFGKDANPKAFTGQGQLPLHAAVGSGNRQAVRLLQQRSPTALLDNKNQTPIDIAAARGYIDILKLLETRGGAAGLALSASDPCNIGDGKDRYRPYQTAAEHGQKETLQYLLPALVNLDFHEFREREKALALAAGQFPALIDTVLGPPRKWPPIGLTEAVIGAIAADQPDSLEQLAKRGFNVHIGLDDQDTTPLHFAAARNAHCCCEWLMRRGASPQAQDITMRTPATLAVLHGCADLARRLIQFDPDFPSQIRSHYLLHSAAKRKDLVMADLLLEHDVDLTARDENGRAALHWALLANDLSMARLLLLAGADIEQLDMKDRSCRSLLTGKGLFAERVLSCAGICSTSDQRKETPLHTAVRLRDLALLQVVLYRLHPDQPNGQSQTPLHLAALLGKQDAALLLMQEGADLEARDKFGRTPLCLALLETKGLALVEVLVNNGAQIDAIDAQGHSAEQIIHKRREKFSPHLFDQLLALLRDRGSAVEKNGLETESQADNRQLEARATREPAAASSSSTSSTDWCAADVQQALLQNPDEDFHNVQFQSFSTSDLHSLLTYAARSIEPARASLFAKAIGDVLAARCDLEMLPSGQSEQFRVAEDALANRADEFAFVSLNQLPKDLLMLLIVQALISEKQPCALRLCEYIRKKR